MIHIGEEAPAEAGARDRLLDRAMGLERVLKPSERLREGRLPATGLSLVARHGVSVVGSVRLWHIATGDGRACLLLGPLAVDPLHQGSGVGSALMETAIAEATARGHDAILLVGDAPYYARFGFSAGHTKWLKMPAPVLRRRFLGLELKAGALAGACGKLVATGQPAFTPMVGTEIALVA